MSLSYSKRSWWGDGKGSKRRQKRGRLHRKRRFYDPKDGENITCVAKAHTLPHFMYIYLGIYIFKDFFDSPPPSPLSNMYTYLPRVCVRVNSIVFTALTIRIKTLKRYSFLLVLLPYPTRDVNVHILCARRLRTNPAEQEKMGKKIDMHTNKHKYVNVVMRRVVYII